VIIGKCSAKMRRKSFCSMEIQEIDKYSGIFCIFGSTGSWVPAGNVNWIALSSLISFIGGNTME